MAASKKQQRFRRILRIAKKGTAHVLEMVRAFLADYPDHPGAKLQLGRTLVEMARYDEARRIFKSLIPRAPAKQLPWVYRHLGDLYEFRGDYSRAASWYRKAIQSRPRGVRYGSLHLYLGCVLAQSGRLDEALAAHRRALRCRDVCRDEVWLNIGYVLRAQEKYGEAGRCFKKAIELDPNYREAKEALADVESAIALLKNRPI